MRTETKEIAVGAIVFSVFLGIMIFMYSVREDIADASEGIHVSASFNRIDGLSEGDPVYLSGVRIGSVERKLLNKDFRAVVTFWLKGGIELPSDSSAAIHTDGLFGSKFIVLEPGAEETLLKNGSLITFLKAKLTAPKMSRSDG
jgi:phospholipid/cholesterol/gamma-HCH transport system substrate-binding protein